MASRWISYGACWLMRTIESEMVAGTHLHVRRLRRLGAPPQRVSDSALALRRDMQTCYRCGKSKPLGAFTTRVDDRHYRMCRACVSEILLARSAHKVRLPHWPDRRTCYLCRRVLPNAKFTRRSTSTYFSACKDCNRHVFGQRRRARMRAAPGAYTVAEWEMLVAQYDRCPRCLRAWADIAPRSTDSVIITADHIVALAKGGSNFIENIQPLCYSCNSQKGDRS
jgi:5-methylcytosine-specific restriction endonuclease McrA